VSALKAKYDRMKTCDLNLGLLFYLPSRCSIDQNVSCCDILEDMP
jgi:hypothetical protein